MLQFGCPANNPLSQPHGHFCESNYASNDSKWLGPAFAPAMPRPCGPLTRWETHQTLRYSTLMNQPTEFIPRPQDINLLHLSSSHISWRLTLLQIEFYQGIGKGWSNNGCIHLPRDLQEFVQIRLTRPSRRETTWNHPPSTGHRHFTAPLRGQCRYPKPKRTHSVSPNPRPQKGGIQGTQIFYCKVESWIKWKFRLWTCRDLILVLYIYII